MFVRMSSEELIGKNGALYVAAKTKLASLEAQARVYSEQLTKAIELLSRPYPLPAASGMPPNAVVAIPVEYPPMGQTQELIAEIAKTDQELKRYRQELSKLGLNVAVE